jgi:hypothetical protein
MATVERSEPKATPRPSRKRNIRPEVSAIGKQVIEENRESLDLLEAYDRGDPEAVRLLDPKRR